MKLDENKDQQITLRVANALASDFGLKDTRLDVNVIGDLNGKETLLFTLNLPLGAALHALVAECANVRILGDRRVITESLGERCAEQFNQQWPEK